MSIKKFLHSRAFFTNLTLAILLICALLFIILQSLKYYTRHGQSNPVPDFTGLTPIEAENQAKAIHIKTVVIDSVFTDEVNPGEIIEQIPEPNFGVKENRTVFLTINSTNKEKVVLPKLTEISFRQAKVLVENCGLKIGEISYQPSEYNNLVLKVEQGGVEIKEGTLLFKGTLVNFIIGQDSENEQTILPDLSGLKLEEAKDILSNAMLNYGVVIFDESITTMEDSANAVIWRQLPDTKTTSTVKLGRTVDLWITVSQDKLDKIQKPEQVPGSENTEN